MLARTHLHALEYHEVTLMTQFIQDHVEGKVGNMVLHSKIQLMPSAVLFFILIDDAPLQLKQIIRKYAGKDVELIPTFYSLIENFPSDYTDFDISYLI
jgi:hypothetical protein